VDNNAKEQYNYITGIIWNTDCLPELFLRSTRFFKPYFVDVSIYDRLSNPDLRAHIDRVGKVLYPVNE
jgi:hypothetical protein